MKDDVRSLKISTPDVKQLRILLHGPVGSGKSSFINSIDSIFQERMTSGAIAEAVTDHSFTKIFQMHSIKDQSYHSFLPITLCDIMGLEDGYSEGVETDDLKKVLQGHIRDGFAFNPGRSCSERDPHYNSNPQLSDQIHCLVSVIPANKTHLMDDAVIDKIKEVREEATRLRIPQVTVLTKVDEACPGVFIDLKVVYRSKKIRDKMHECSNRLGIPMNCIFPVKCYHEEIQLNDAVDVLLLSALTTILNFANDHVAEMAQMAPPTGIVRGSSTYNYLQKDPPPLPAPPTGIVRGSSSQLQKDPPPLPPRTYQKDLAETFSAVVKVGEGSSKHYDRHYDRHYDSDKGQPFPQQQYSKQTEPQPGQRSDGMAATGGIAPPPGDTGEGGMFIIHEVEHIHIKKEKIVIYKPPAR